MEAISVQLDLLATETLSVTRREMGWPGAEIFVFLKAACKGHRQHCEDMVNICGWATAKSCLTKLQHGQSGSFGTDGASVEKTMQFLKQNSGWQISTENSDIVENAEVEYALRLYFRHFTSPRSGSTNISWKPLKIFPVRSYPLHKQQFISQYYSNIRCMRSISTFPAHHGWKIDCCYSMFLLPKL